MTNTRAERPGTGTAAGRPAPDEAPPSHRRDDAETPPQEACQATHVESAASSDLTSLHDPLRVRGALEKWSINDAAG